MKETKATQFINLGIIVTLDSKPLYNSMHIADHTKSVITKLFLIK